MDLRSITPLHPPGFGGTAGMGRHVPHFGFPVSEPRFGPVPDTRGVTGALRLAGALGPRPGWPASGAGRARWLGSPYFGRSGYGRARFDPMADDAMGSAVVHGRRGLCERFGVPSGGPVAIPAACRVVRPASRWVSPRARANASIACGSGQRPAPRSACGKAGSPMHGGVIAPGTGTAPPPARTPSQAPCATPSRCCAAAAGPGTDPPPPLAPVHGWRPRSATPAPGPGALRVGDPLFLRGLLGGTEPPVAVGVEHVEASGAPVAHLSRRGAVPGPVRFLCCRKLPPAVGRPARRRWQGSGQGSRRGRSGGSPGEGRGVLAALERGRRRARSADGHSALTQLRRPHLAAAPAGTTCAGCPLPQLPGSAAALSRACPMPHLPDDRLSVPAFGPPSRSAAETGLAPFRSRRAGRVPPAPSA